MQKEQKQHSTNQRGNLSEDQEAKIKELEQELKIKELEQKIDKHKDKPAEVNKSSIIGTVGMVLGIVFIFFALTFMPINNWDECMNNTAFTDYEREWGEDYLWCEQMEEESRLERNITIGIGAILLSLGFAHYYRTTKN